MATTALADDFLMLAQERTRLPLRELVPALVAVLNNPASTNILVRTAFRTFSFISFTAPRGDSLHIEFARHVAASRQARGAGNSGIVGQSHQYRMH